MEQNMRVSHYIYIYYIYNVCVIHMIPTKFLSHGSLKTDTAASCGSESKAAMALAPSSVSGVPALSRPKSPGV